MHKDKRCFSCGIAKPTTEYYRSNTRYFQRECKECTKQRRSKWWRSPTGKLSSANTKLKARFGITLDEYHALLDQQGGECLICFAHLSVMGHRLAVDHCHKTGRIRGLLCKSCNVGIGNFDDCPERLRRAAAYLERTAPLDSLHSAERPEAQHTHKHR